MKILPPLLRPGDWVGITAPASKIKYEDVTGGIAILKDEWGLNVLEGSTLNSAFHQFSASDADRLLDLQNMLDNPDIKAIFAARGGYGCSRIVDQLDFTGFMKHPKWIIGYSDLTAFHLHLHHLGYASLHAPMIKNFTEYGAETAVNSLKTLLFDGSITYELPPHELNRPGKTSGMLIGGNLCLINHLTGSVSELDSDGKILFIEDVDEYYFSLDRMMVQLKRSGQLSKLAGLIVGQFTDMKDQSDNSFGFTAEEIVREHTREYSYPIVCNFPAGHIADNRALCFGREVKLIIDTKGVIFSY